RARDMRSRGVDRDHEIEVGDGRRGLREIGELAGEVGDGAGREPREVGLAFPHLQTEPADAGGAEQRRKALERDRTVAVVFVLWGAGPYEADLHALGADEALAPASDGVVVDFYVRN